MSGFTYVCVAEMLLFPYLSYLADRAHWSSSVIAYTLMGSYFLVAENVFRVGDARSIAGHRSAGSEKKPFWHVTRCLPVGGIMLCLLIPVVGRYITRGSWSLAWIVEACLVVVMLSSMALRWYAMATLGRWFSTVLRVVDGQKLLRHGPYSLVRHPGYFSTLLLFTSGSLLVSGSLWTCCVTVAVFMATWMLRISAEERVLRNSFGAEHEQYCQAVKWRLVPFLW